jgi:hypothetical protein
LGLRGGKVTGEWRKLHIEEFNDLYCSPNINQAIKLIRMKWAGHVAHMENRGVYRVLCRKLKERDHLENIGIDGKIILRWIFRKWDGVGHRLD